MSGIDNAVCQLCKQPIYIKYLVKTIIFSLKQLHLNNIFVLKAPNCNIFAAVSIPLVFIELIYGRYTYIHVRHTRTYKRFLKVCDKNKQFSTCSLPRMREYAFNAINITRSILLMFRYYLGYSSPLYYLEMCT